MSSSEHRARRAFCARLVGGLALAGGLAGCGFHLRGQIDLPFQTLYLSAPTAPQIAAAMQRAIEGSGSVKLVDTSNAAQVILEIPSVVDDKQVLSLSGGGRVREYALTKRVAFSLHDATGRDWLPAGEVTIRRTYSFNESEVLAREFQEQKYLVEMQTDAVQQVLRRLQAAKKPAA
jgi:LPS-assembly lipoprotein